MILFLISTALAAPEAALGVAKETAASGGVAATLGLNIWQFIAQLVNFGLLIFVLRLVLYKPLVKFMSDRSNRIASGLEQARLYDEKIKELETERKTVLFKAEEEGRQKIAEASKLADEIVAEAKTKISLAENQSRQKMERAAVQYKDEALADVRAQAGELVVLAAEKVLRGVVTKKVDAKLVTKALKDVSL